MEAPLKGFKKTAQRFDTSHSRKINPWKQLHYEAEGIQIQGVVVGQLRKLSIKILGQRIIALVDMNSFFASIEQMDYPEFIW
jgi:Nucleotidyltransferase/DNA polymerase involved in DNA repair